jgi:signal transduction histidine kinase
VLRRQQLLKKRAVEGAAAAKSASPRAVCGLLRTTREAVAIELQTNLGEALEQLESLVDIGRELTSTLDLSQVLVGVVRHARRLLRAKVASLLLERRGHFDTVATDGAGPHYLSRGQPDIHTTLVGRVVRTGLPVTVADVRSEPGFRFAEVAEREGLVSLLSVPLRSRDRILGVLNVYSDVEREFHPQEVTLATLLAQQSAVAIENAALFREAREAGERLRKSEKLAALGRLSAGLAHELRNPLNTLNVLTYAMAETASRTGASLADVEVVQAEIRRMNLLLEQFLDFARPRPPTFQRQRVEEILEETLLLVGPEAAKKRIVVEREPIDSTPPVWADGDQLKQVLLNLALNAIQAMPDGGRLRAGVRTAGGSVVIELADTGIGILPEVRERLFEPFFTTREGGHGLGLAIAGRIVEAHSGELRIDSEPGKGTTAAVWLPI